MFDFSYKKYQNNFPAPRERVLKYYDKEEDTLVTDIPATHSSRRYTLVGAATNPNYTEEQRLYDDEQLRLDTLLIDDLFAHYELERTETYLTLWSLCRKFSSGVDRAVIMFKTFIDLLFPPDVVPGEEEDPEGGTP